MPLCHEIYNAGNRTYWEMLDRMLREYTKQPGLEYVTNDDSMTRLFNAPPVVVNYFYHEQIKKLTRKDGAVHA